MAWRNSRKNEMEYLFEVTLPPARSILGRMYILPTHVPPLRVGPGAPDASLKQPVPGKKGCPDHIDLKNVLSLFEAKKKGECKGLWHVTLAIRIPTKAY